MNKPNYNIITPFKRWTIQNFPFIEEDFDAITNYQLLCKIVEYLNKVIENEKELERVNNELIDAFNNLKTYVDNYFDELNLQEEVNNKLDSMVESGEMAEIINQEIFSELNNKVNTNTNDINTLNNNVSNLNYSVSRLNEDVTLLENNVNDEKMNNYRKKYYSNYHNFIFPNEIPNFLKNINIFESYDKKNYKYSFDKESFKVTGGNVYYVDGVNGNDSYDGLTSETAWRSIQHAYRYATNNSTILIKKGIYYRNYLPNSVQNLLQNNLNIICEENTLMGMFDNLSYTQNLTYSNVYQAERSGSLHALDIRGYENGVISQLAEVETLEECANTLNSFYKDSANVYINIGEPVDSTKVIISLDINFSSFRVSCENASKDLYLYLENAIIINGSVPVVSVESSASYQATFIGINDKFLYKNQFEEEHNGIDFLGSDSLLYKCEASFNGKDGFNYHKKSGKACNGIELECVGSYNGLRTTMNSCNGSTIHDGGKIIRINGKYFNNRGGNVADVQEDTVSYNFNCVAFDSLATNPMDSLKSDFANQQAGGTMYLFNCFTKGSKSVCNLFNHENATMYISNTEYDTSVGDIIEI